jgi:hypothetical protein
MSSKSPPTFHVLYLSREYETPIAIFIIEKDLEDFCLMRFNTVPSEEDRGIEGVVKYYVF